MKPRALVVHDHPGLASRIADTLVSAGFVVDVVDSGLAAIRKVWEERYDRVLVRAGLGGMAPRQLVRHLMGLAPDAEVLLVDREPCVA
jgi:DNA-binding response OmpR family regulator